MGWFTKKDDECPHGNTGSCPRCVMADDEDLQLYVPLKDELVRECIARLPDQLQRKMKQHGKTAIVAGGYIRDVMIGEKPQDIDVFTVTANVYDIANALPGTPTKRKTSIVSENAYGVAPIQISDRFKFSTPEGLIDQFDFSIARAAIWYDKTKKNYVGICWHSWEQDCYGKHLVYLDRNPEVDSILRLVRFVGRGYRVDIDSVARIATGTVVALPSGKKLDPDIIEAEIIQTLEAQRDVPVLDVTPYKEVDRTWSGS